MIAVNDLPRAIPESWLELAACKGMGPAAFFPDRHAGIAIRAVCAECPVRHQCLEYALANDVHHGIWGGLSERQRRSIRRYRGSL